MSRKLSTVPADVLTRNGLGTLAEMEARIFGYWSRATADDMAAGASWYGADAETLLSDLIVSGAGTREHAASVLSKLSPRTTWNRNVNGAFALVTGGVPAARSVGCMRPNVLGAWQAFTSPTPLDTFGPGAPKTARFARNLLGDRSVVTIDVWAARIAFPAGMATADVETALGRVGVYGVTEHAYQTVAASVGVDATTVQATTWIVARNGRAA